MNTMEYKGFYARIMEAPRLEGDQVHGLPPGTPLPVYYADAFINYPENWMKGPGVFVVPVRPDKGLWFDWRRNSEINTAVLPTVKGCNPITGLQTSGFHLEKYENKCPKHGCDFLAERFCPKCNFKWSDRNYCSMNPLWWDGFRSEDGTVRQFFFTEEMMRDIATHLIGEKNTVPAFGFAFYTPKERRQEPAQTMRGVSFDFFEHSWNLKGSIKKRNFLRSHAVRRKTIEVSVGAGAKIRQALNQDSYSLDSWKDKPDASMTIYFVFHEKLEELKSKGMRDFKGTKEGMLKNLPVG